jgi:peptide/nickel transport system substrate-binding protein
MGGAAAGFAAWAPEVPLKRFIPMLAAGLAILTLAGCVSREARFGKVLIFGKAKDAVKLDPAEVNEGESSAVTLNIFDTLVAFQPGATTIVPALAKNWAVSPDGRRYTFTLREGVRFHDGTLLDASAVKFNFDRQRDPKHPNHTGVYEYWLNFFEPVVKAIETPDARTVVFTLKQQDATFLSNMALFAMGIVSPAAIRRYGKDIVRHPVGTGPFKFVTWVPSQKIILEANADYWGGRPAIDKLVFKPIPENAVRLLELENGSIHGMSGINPDDVARIQRHPRLKLQTGPGMNVGYMALNMDKPPLDRPLVRRAIAHAVNKEAMVKAFFAGGTLGRAAVNPLPPSVWGYNDQLKDYPHDPAEARRLLKQAGLPNGFKLTLWALPVARPYMPQGQRTAEALQADLARAGIDVTITTFEWGTYLDKLSKGDHQAALIGWNGDNGDPDNFLYTLLDANNARPGSASNYSFYRDPEVHRLLLAARRVSDQAARAKLYREAQARIHADVPLVPLFHSVQMIAFRKEVEGFVLSPMSDLSFNTVRLADPATQQKP